MAYPGSLDPAQPAKQAAVKAVAAVVDKHLRHEVLRPTLRDDPSTPVLLHVDGPGKSQLIQELEQRLDPLAPGLPGAGLPQIRRPRHSPPLEKPWSAVRFDAWQFQRVAPPWWWLINSLDRQLRLRFRRQGWRPWLWKRVVDYALRGLQFVKDIAWALPGILAFLVGWQLSHLGMHDFVTKLGTLVGGLAALIGAVTAILAFGSSLRNALRRHLLSESPRGASALLHSTDPMADLLRRYRFLVRTAGTPIIVLIDNLDRCQADYVVALLEGIQTLLRVPEPDRRCRSRAAKLFRRLKLQRSADPDPLVAFVVAADQGWLCESYLRVYQDFTESAREPGRPFGLSFLDKIFEVSLRLPTVPSATTMSSNSPAMKSDSENPFSSCRNETEVRERLRALEQAAHGEAPRPGNTPHSAQVDQTLSTAPQHHLRVDAVCWLGELETGTESDERQCADTGDVLSALIATADLGPVVAKRLETAYCVQRTSQLLGGHAVDADGRDAIRRLAIWTMLGLRWPQLAKHLSASPMHLEHLRRGEAPDGVNSDIAPVFSHPAARRLVAGLDVRGLTADDICRFTVPLTTATAGDPAHELAAQSREATGAMTAPVPLQPRRALS